MKQLIRKIAQQFGIDIVRHRASHSNYHYRVGVLRDLGIKTILDVGANSGQFVELVREEGWVGNVISFEPLPDAFAVLHQKSLADNNWEVRNQALGNFDGDVQINIAANSQSSSILPFKDDFVGMAEDLKQTGSVSVPIQKLDTVFANDFGSSLGPIYLKLDVQGFEKNVILGGKEVLSNVAAIQSELSLETCYEGALGFLEMRDLLREFGFVLNHLRDGWANPSTGELVEADGIFTRPR